MCFELNRCKVTWSYVKSVSDLLDKQTQVIRDAAISHFLLSLVYKELHNHQCLWLALQCIFWTFSLCPISPFVI